MCLSITCATDDELAKLLLNPAFTPYYLSLIRAEINKRNPTNHLRRDSMYRELKVRFHGDSIDLCNDTSVMGFKAALVWADKDNRGNLGDPDGSVSFYNLDNEPLEVIFDDMCCPVGFEPEGSEERREAERKAVKAAHEAERKQILQLGDDLGMEGGRESATNSELLVELFEAVTAPDDQEIRVKDIVDLADELSIELPEPNDWDRVKELAKKFGYTPQFELERTVEKTLEDLLEVMEDPQQNASRIQEVYDLASELNMKLHVEVDEITEHGPEFEGWEARIATSTAQAWACKFCGGVGREVIESEAGEFIRFCCPELFFSS
jgi:hypothetical protein